ncbi:hypothetical protein Tco_0253084 [Tanacetum coccineum]
MPTEMELTLEQTQQGVSYEVSTVMDPVTLCTTLPSHSRTSDDTSNSLVHGYRAVCFEDVPIMKHAGSILMDPENITSPQDGKVSQDGVKRLCLVDDLKMFKITMSNTSSWNMLNPEVNDHYNIFTRESQEYELKTRDEA